MKILRLRVLFLTFALVSLSDVVGDLASRTFNAYLRFGEKGNWKTASELHLK